MDKQDLLNDFDRKTQGKGAELGAGEAEWLQEPLNHLNAGLWYLRGVEEGAETVRVLYSAVLRDALRRLGDFELVESVKST